MRTAFVGLRALSLVGALLFGAAATGCAHRTPVFDTRARPTCLVLSVGGARGVAHLGAIAAVKQAGVPVSCVIGNSMGALVGGLYASAPGADTEARFRQLAAAYVRESRAEAGKNGLLLGLALGVITAAATGDPTGKLPLLAAGGGFALGARLTAPMDRDRLVRVMDQIFGGASIERLPLSYATSFQRRKDEGLDLVTTRDGNLAAAIGKSLANPYVFDNLDVVSAGDLDPGADRAAMTPVEDACRLFPGANLLAVNVSGQPLFYSGQMTCPVREVRVATGAIDAEAVFRLEAAFADTVRAGFDATVAALR